MAIFECHQESNWPRIFDQLDEVVRRRLNVLQLERGWVGMACRFGRLEHIGVPSGRRVGDDTLIEAPLHFEAGDVRGLVRFSLDGNVTGLAIRPAQGSVEPA
ncbi:MAG TPA: hypothetical protein VFD49_23035 [Candidatus Dormibacteraeota bacterium]|nr:hypothetical protein [Candidatus Dormibacteraeota bacterium]